MSTATKHSDRTPTPKPEAVAEASRLAFRPWGTDSMADIVQQDSRKVTLAYDHDPTKRYSINRHDLANIGRFVTRSAYPA